MHFMVPTVDGDGWMAPDDAESAWQACRKGAEGDTGQKADPARIYRLRYTHNGKTLEATVGDRDPLDNQTVMAIVSFGSFYKICLVIRGYLKVGDTPMAGAGSVLDVEYFDPESYPTE